MELQFNKQDEKWVAEATVNGDYSLHLEKMQDGLFYMQQRSTADGRYAGCSIPLGIGTGNWRALDYVFSHGYYPMNVRFVSMVQITKAELNEIQS